jgi:hypothetical protein
MRKSDEKFRDEQKNVHVQKKNSFDDDDLDCCCDSSIFS